MPDSVDRITLSHGAGGLAMGELIEGIFVAAYGDKTAPRDDSAVLGMSGPVAFTTDSFVVDPIFFPGGDIGRLAIAGTVNDLLTSAARPIAVAAAFIIEEGFRIADLKRIAESMRATADECGVRIVTGDTKVVPRGSAPFDGAQGEGGSGKAQDEGIFITTSGIGEVMKAGVSGASAKPGDRVILTGSIADHGTAVMLAREGLLDTEAIESDAAPLVEIVTNLILAGCDVHAMRDPTRGGIGSALNEIARQSSVTIEIEEDAVLVKPAAMAACEALGIDPFYVANEGKMLIIVAAQDAERALSVVRSSRYGEKAQMIGVLRQAQHGAGRVQLKTTIGATRILAQPTGELLPRIC